MTESSKTLSVGLDVHKESIVVAYAPDAIAAIVDYTEGYPYFLQEYGKIIWDIAPAAEPVSLEVVQEARPAVEDKLDESFFRVRADRTTEQELQYLRAMAELGAGPLRTGDIASVMKRTSEQLGPTRARLIDKGLLYTPGYGIAAFTVPQFDRYMRRAHPAEIITADTSRGKNQGGAKRRR